MRAILTMTLTLLLGCSVLADDPVTKKSDKDKEKPMSFWMEKKLEYSQGMLRGLVVGDLDEVAERARQMRFVSKVEGWIRKGQPGYKAQLQAFDFANMEIERQAKAGKLEGTAMAFQQLTTSCVSCHAMLRAQH